MNASAPSEVLSILALRAQERILERNREIVRANLVLLEDLMRRHAGVLRWTPPRAGCLAFPALETGEPAFEFADRLRRATGVLLAPGPLFLGDPSRFRIGYGRRNFSVGLAHLDAFLSVEK